MNNINDRNTISTLISPVGSFYFWESFDISKKDFDPQLFDVAISLVDRSKFEAPFLTEEDIKDENGRPLVSSGEAKFEFLEEHLVDPSQDDSYYIFGKVRMQMPALILRRDNTFKNDLKYVGTSGNYILLNTTDEIADVKDWSGLSGSPVLNQDGKCVGVLCSVIEGTRSVFVKPFKRILPVLDTIIVLERSGGSGD